MELRMELRHIFIFGIVCMLFVAVGCSREYTPKPKAYPRMDLPEKAYQHFKNDGCPFAFDIPQYAEVEKEPDLRHKNEGEHCWMNVVFKDMNAKFHLSYKEINDKAKLAMLIEDAHKLTSKHIKKAEYIDQRNIATPNKVYGLFSDVGGNTASSMQFFVTDSIQNYLYGSLYFSTTPNYDSIQPAIEFLKKDMLHLIDTFEWKEEALTASR